MYRYIYKWGLDDGEFNARGGGQRQSTGHMDEDARFIFIVFIFTHHNSAAMTKKTQKPHQALLKVKPRSIAWRCRQALTCFCIPSLDKKYNV